MTRLLRFGLPGLVFTALTLAATTRVAAQDPCRQDDPPPPPECWMVDVTPDGGTAGPHTPNTGGYSVEFTIANIGMNGDGYSISCAGAGNVTCTGTSVSSVTLWPGQSTTVTAFYSVGPPGSGTLSLSASSGTGAWDEGYYTITAATPYAVAVTPDGGTTPTRPANSSGHTATFTIQNTGNSANTYGLTCGNTGPVSCTGVSPTSVPLAAGAQTTATATYNVGNPGTGTLTLTATGTSASDNGSFSVPVLAYGVAVTPDGGAESGRPKNTSGYGASFTVQNTGGGSNTYTLACTGSSNVTCTGTTPASVTLGAGGVTTVTATYNVGAAGPGTLTLTASGTFASDPGSYAVPVIDFVPSAVASGALSKDSRYLLQETANTYTNFGQITQLTDARNEVTNYQYGGNGNNAFLIRITRVHDASGTVDLVTDIAYDTDGFVASVKDEGGTFRYFTYDLYGRLRQVKNHSGTVVQAHGYTYSRTGPNWTFDPASPNAVVDTAFIQQTPTVKAVVSTGYLDGLGRPIQTVVQDGANYHVSATQYDLMGRTWRVWKPYTRTTAGFDPNATSPTAGATAWYNNYHNPSTTVPYVETAYTADALSRVKQMTPEHLVGAPNAVVLRTYGVNATNKQQYTLITDEAAKSTRTVTDAFGNVVRSILGAGAPESTVTQFS